MDEICEGKKNMLLRFLHHSMAMTGGFFACYAIMLRADFMGNAQTSNWIYMVMAILGRNPLQFVMRFVGLILYLLGAIVYVVIVRKTKFKVKWIAIVVDVIAVAILSMIPKDCNPIVGLYPIFFAMSLQWNSFPGSYGYVSSTIFSTNNTRQVGLALGEFMISGEKRHLHKMVFFLGSIAGFHIGVVYAYFMVKAYEVQAIWFVLVCLAIASVFLYLEEKEEKLIDKLLHIERNN